VGAECRAPATDWTFEIGALALILLDRTAGNGVRTIIVESPDRFARDLTVQLTGHDFLKSLEVELIPATAPDFFTEDTPTAVLVRQVLGAIAQFEKTSLVAKLKAARERSGHLGGRKSYAESRPETVELAKQLRRDGHTFREIPGELAALGHLTSRGKPYHGLEARALGNGICAAHGRIVEFVHDLEPVRFGKSRDSRPLPLVRILVRAGIGGRRRAKIRKSGFRRFCHSIDVGGLIT